MSKNPERIPEESSKNPSRERRFLGFIAENPEGSFDDPLTPFTSRPFYFFRHLQSVQNSLKIRKNPEMIPE